jgi:N-sulfoglucosamine sulfohydrolase
MPPNILFFTCHDLGQHLGCYGRSTVPSPALDALARSGVLFERSFCTAPQCSPSRAALHTGRYPHATGMLGLAHEPFGWRLRPGERHMAERLHELGYATALVGMQHVTARDRAAELGYDEVRPVRPAGEEAEAAVGLLAELSRREPFYLEVGFEEPHRPYDFGGAQPEASRGVAIPGYLPQTPEARQDLAAFQGAVRQMDAGVGRVLAALDQLGLAEGTWVVFATDHGIAMPRAKGTLYDPGIEAALLMRWPGGGVGGGAGCAELVSNVDVVPTLLDGLGQPLGPELQGRSLWPLLHGRRDRPREDVFAEKTYHTHYEPMRAVRTATHKLIVNFEIGQAVDVPTDVQQSPIYPQLLRRFAPPRPTVELYDLTSDPWEQTNLADEPGLTAVQRELVDRLRRWMGETEDPILDGPIASPYYAAALARLR